MNHLRKFAPLVAALAVLACAQAAVAAPPGWREIAQTSTAFSSSFGTAYFVSYLPYVDLKAECDPPRRGYYRLGISKEARWNKRAPNRYYEVPCDGQAHVIGRAAVSPNTA